MPKLEALLKFTKALKKLIRKCFFIKIEDSENIKNCSPNDIIPIEKSGKTQSKKKI